MSGPSIRASRALLAACFFLSGGAGLVYEVLWSRHLHLLFGSTTESVAAVLATFMAGLGLGGHLLGRAADRSRSPMRLYGLLEIGVGLYAFLTPALLALAQRLYATAAPHLAPGGAAQTLLKLVLAAIVLVPPATLMGGTLPALVRATADTAERARKAVGLLYALNTLGAVVGTLATGFVLIEVLGLSTSMQLTGVLNLGVGALVYVRAMRHMRAGQAAEAAPVEPDAGGAFAAMRLLLSTVTGRYAVVGLFVSGATVMLYEVVFTRVLGLVFGVSSYAFSMVLGVFLAGLGLGALLAHRIARGRVPRSVDFGVSQIALGAVAVLAMALVPSVPRLLLYARQVPDLGFWQVLGVKTALALGFLLPLALVAGLGVPLLLAALAGDLGRAGRLVGDAYMVNTAGTLAGSLLTGFVLVEKLGTQGSLRAAALVNLGVGAWGLLVDRDSRRRLVAAAAAIGLAALAIAAPRWPVNTFLLSDTRGRQAVQTSRLALEQQLALAPAELLFFAEGRDATVAVTASGDRTLYVNGHPDASDRLDMATQAMLAVVPLAAHRAPEDVLVIGFGSGVTGAVAARVDGVARVEVVELERAVLAASPHFGHVNHDIEHDPRVRLVHDDARSFLLAPPHRFDAIVSEPSNPWRAGVAALFTVDYYRAARAALKPGGVFAQWVQLYGLSEGTLRMVLRTIGEAFPELQVWWLDPGNLVVLASEAPLPLERARVEKIVGGPLAKDLERAAWLGAPGELFGRFLLGTAEARAFVEAGGGEPVPAHTDDQPLLEYEAPRGLFEGDGQNSLRLLAEKLARGALLPPLAGPPPEPGDVWTSIATMYRTSKRLPEARVAMERALAAVRTARHLAFAAEIAIEAGDLSAAGPLLVEARGLLTKDAPDLGYVAEMEALLAAHRRQLPQAVALLDEAGGLDGKRGVARLRALVALRRAAEAMEQARRLLDAARPGAEIEAMEVEQVYRALTDLARGGGDPTAIAALIEERRAAGFPSFPREKALAVLFERAGRAEEALAHARTAQAGGALDLVVMGVEARALAALGRGAEAGVVEARRRALSPAQAIPEVRSPLLREPGREPAASAGNE